MVHVNVFQKGKKSTLELGSAPTLGSLKAKFHESNKKYYPARQGFKLCDSEGKPTGGTMAGDNELLSELGVAPGANVAFKDLGAQFSYRGVFIIEYLGPLVFVLLYALRPAFLYGEGADALPWHPTAQLGVIMWTIHFAKREFETLFIHRFSRPTMPAFNLIKNSAYYWTFGLIIGFPLCHPQYSSPEETQVMVGLAIFAVSELGNFICHVMLRNLRPAEGERKRPIPKGFLFNWVSCPNYTFEVLGWVGFGIATQIAFVYLFTVVGFLQMWQWAIGKHKGYLKSYGDEYKKLRRTPIVPLLC